MIPVALVLFIGPTPLVASADFPPDAQWKAVAACPRIVTTTGQYGTSTGVVVGVKDGQAYILTAAHTVAEVGAGREALFYPPATYPKPTPPLKPVVVAHRLPAADVAVLTVRIPPDTTVPTLKLIAPGRRPKAFPFPVLAVGCSGGDAPTCRTDIVRGKRFVRRPEAGDAFFWETDVPPVPGRSGGPLLDADGKVIGLCAANMGSRGYYTHTDELHAGLKRHGLAWLWE
jgi:S1-C subfamily serine protease